MVVLVLLGGVYIAYPRKYAVAVASADRKLIPADWDAMVDAANGITLSGVRSYAAAYIVRINGGFYEGIDSEHNLDFGGALDAGGAIGTDATDVIQHCVDAMTDGGLIFIKEGAFNGISGVHVDADAISIVGSGEYATIITITDVNDSVFSVLTAGKLTIESLSIHGSGRANANSGVEVNGVWGTTVRDCYIGDCQNAIYVQGDSGDTTLENLYIDNVVTGIKGAAGGARGETVVANNVQIVVDGAVNPDYGVDMGLADACWFKDVAVETAQQKGFNFDEISASRTTLTNCHVFSLNEAVDASVGIGSEGALHINGGFFKGQMDGDAVAPNYVIYIQNMKKASINNARLEMYTTDVISTDRYAIGIEDSILINVDAIEVIGKTGAIDRPHCFAVALIDSNQCWLGGGTVNSIACPYIVESGTSNENIIMPFNGYDIDETTARVTVLGADTICLTVDKSWVGLDNPRSLRFKGCKGESFDRIFLLEDANGDLQIVDAAGTWHRALYRTAGNMLELGKLDGGVQDFTKIIMNSTDGLGVVGNITADKANAQILANAVGGSIKCGSGSFIAVTADVGASADVAVAKVGGGTRTLTFKNGLYISYADS